MIRQTEPYGNGKGGHKKAKLLYLMRILLEQTDEQHGITMPQIMEHLGAYGIRAERKSIYGDLDILKEFGLDIRKRKLGSFQYYVGNRDFAPREWELLADAIQYYPLITPREADGLVVKLQRQCGVHQAKRLCSRVFIPQPPDSRLKELEGSIGRIGMAIREKKPLTFREFHWEAAGGEKQGGHTPWRYGPNGDALRTAARRDCLLSAGLHR